MPRKKPKVLYHYCSVQTFYSIVKKQSIWLSDIGKSNDSLELKWIKGQCSRYILEAWVNYAKAANELGEINKVDFEKYDKLQKQFQEIIKLETEKCWAFCLSEKYDDLGQWRGYADDGCGVSIGFKSSYFQKISSNKPDITESSSVAFDRVTYDEQETNKLFYETCGLSLINAQMNSEEVIEILRRAVVYSLFLSPFYKNPKFAEEKEWRLIFATTIKELLNGKIPNTEFNRLFPENEIRYSFLAQNNRLVSHIEFIDKDLANSISEIWIGPKCKLSSIDIKLFLISAGFIQDCNDDSIKIHKSQASYR